MVRVAVIDSGVCHKKYKSIGKIESYIVKDKKITVDDTEYNSYTHGSCCAAIIDKYSNFEFELISIKVLDEYGRGNIDDLLCALIFCIDHNIEIVSLSCGTIVKKDFKKVQKVLKRRKRNLNIIIAAQNNNKQTTFPACSTYAIGVRCNAEMHNLRYNILSNEADGIEVEASGIHIISNEGKNYVTPPCSSYANAMITGIVVNSLSENEKPNKQHALHFLSCFLEKRRRHEECGNRTRSFNEN